MTVLHWPILSIHSAGINIIFDTTNLHVVTLLARVCFASHEKIL